MTIRRFEEIESWREARLLAAQIYKVTRRGKFVGDFGLRDQIRRACISVMANIAEGFGRGSRAEFVRFLRISHASALETQSHLYMAVDLGYLDASEFEALHNRATRVARMIGGFIDYLSNDAKRTKELMN